MTEDLPARADTIRRGLQALQAQRASVEPCRLARLDDVRDLLGAAPRVARLAEDAELTAVRALMHAPTGRAGGPRWWCADCGAFARSESAPCGKCRHTGPHVFAVSSPLEAGNRQRRARLKREEKRRKGQR